MSNKAAYLLINLALASVFGFIFIYTGLIVKNHELQMDCYYVKNNALPCPTCGLTRDFSRILHGDLSVAKQMNKNSIPLFCFFSFQLFLRIGVGIYLSKVNNCTIKNILSLDILISTFALTLAVHNIILDIYRR